MRSRAREVEDVPELMQDIQSRLPLEQAARTCLLSKSWLHAWSTISTLRFRVLNHQDQDIKSMKLVDVDRTMMRYLHDNIPIEKFDLLIDIENQESASLVEKWIRPVVTKTCLKEFSLLIILDRAPFTLPDEILSGENLTKLRLSSPLRNYVWMKTPVIRCVSTLRELHLDGVCISEETLHDILSSCTLLVKIELLHSCVGFKTIKVKNLPCLYELRITLDSGLDYGYQNSTALEISDVPNLGVFDCNLHSPFKRQSISSLGSRVTQLSLGGGVITDNSCLDLIKSGFPFLESLTLDKMSSWKLKSFHFTCASIKRLTLQFCPRRLIDVQIHAPNLLFFQFDGGTLPIILLFPVSTLEQITVSLRLDLPVVDAVCFFLKMREVLALSHKCDVDITISNCDLPWDIDINDLRTRLLFPPATNVQQLWFKTSEDEGLWERSPFFDAFFEICRPKYVYAEPDMEFRHNNHFCRVMLREVLEKTTTTTTPCWTCHLKHVQIRQEPRELWEILTNSHRSFLDGSAPDDVFMHFKLIWR